MDRFTAVLTLAFSLVTPALASAATVPSGLWDGTVVVNGVAIPFRFELSTHEAQARGAFFNGDDRVSSTSGSFDGSELALDFAHYASKLRARWDNGALSGVYGRKGGNTYLFQAQPHVEPAPAKAAAPNIAGDWEIAVTGPKGASVWQLAVRQSGADVAASILRVDGDTGLLSGRFSDGKFVLAHFSGARPLLIELTPQADGSLAVTENQKTKFTALRAQRARERHAPKPPDPSRWTSVNDPSQPLRYSGQDLAGNTVTEADPRFHGKVVLVNIMGSWCPNCHDEAPFLQELYQAYRARGLEIVSLSFEGAEQAKDPERLRAFIETYGITYPVLLAGDPSEVGAKLPQAKHLTTWPATFFVGRDGLVHGAHAGFAGKATGAAHERLKAELRATVEELLAKKLH